MISIILNDQETKKPLWVDLFNPTKEELDKIARDFNIPTPFINDCLDPDHLPKYEKIRGTTMVMVRSYDEECSSKDSLVPHMSRKLTLILGDRYLISIHKKQQTYLNEIVQTYINGESVPYLQKILIELLLAAIETFHLPLEQAEMEIQNYEQTLFKKEEDEMGRQSIFITKSRLMVIKRMLWHTTNAVQKFVPSSDINRPLSQDLTERVTGQIFFIDGLIDNLNNLLHIQLSLYSHSTNRIMRVLTLFSAIFMPLTFIVGVYRMNFKFMPELGHEYGYPGVWILIVSTSVVILLWFKKNHWIKFKNN